MTRNRPQPVVLSLFLLFCLTVSLLPRLVLAAEEDVSQHDPQRWYQGDDTPRLHYRNLLKEAYAAHTEALQECRSLRAAAARQCRADARRDYAADKARAKRIRAQLMQQ